MSDLKDLVKGKTVSFTFYRDGELWYKVDGTDFTFPVPISDTGGAVFSAVDKAILFMRYIRKHLEMLEKAKQEIENEDDGA